MKRKTNNTKNKRGAIRINIKPSLGSSELQWDDKEYKSLVNRIARLHKDQVTALLALVGLDFSKKDIENVSEDILKDGRYSGHLDILIYEANSKDNLLWWIDYFERNNKKETAEA